MIPYNYPKQLEAPRHQLTVKALTIKAKMIRCGETIKYDDYSSCVYGDKKNKRSYEDVAIILDNNELDYSFVVKIELFDEYMDSIL